MTAAAAACTALLSMGGVAHANCGDLIADLLQTNCSGRVASPDPGGTESPDQPVPPVGKRFGFNSSLALRGLATPEQELDAARAAGATAHAMPVPWRGFQSSAGAPPLSPGDAQVDVIDRFYAAAAARGITPVFTTYWAPVWASRYRNCGLLDFACQSMSRSDRKLVPDRPFLDDYEEFVRAVKARWPRALIQSWNEPNLHWEHSHYTGTNAYAAGPEHFAEIQCAAYRGSKAVNGDPVLAAGWGWHRFSDYVGRVYAAGGADCWDLANVHLYAQDALELGANTWFARRLDAARILRSKYGDADPIWVTETGWTTTGGSEYRVTEAEQADVTRRAYNRLMTMPDIGAVLFHTLLDPTAPNADHPGDGFGFIRGNWTPKLAYCQFAGAAGNQVDGC